jgi:SAM-dependent methyltransferase
MTHASFDFGYPWWLSTGHLMLFGCGIVALVAAVAFKWRRGLLITLAVFTAWAGAAALVVGSLDLNGVPPLPTERFLQSGRGVVLDLGAGTGRSSIMVLTARPQATVVASDLFGDSFALHFGTAGTPQSRLLANLRAAGVDDRATIETADMRRLPFESARFDAIVSAYAMDHLGREGARQGMAEARRVLKPGGDFLLILVADDWWTRLAFGPMLAHGGTNGREWWQSLAAEAGFETIEAGSSPATLSLLLGTK